MCHRIYATNVFSAATHTSIYRVAGVALNHKCEMHHHMLETFQHVQFMMSSYIYSGIYTVCSLPTCITDSLII